MLLHFAAMLQHSVPFAPPTFHFNQAKSHLIAAYAEKKVNGKEEERETKLSRLTFASQWPHKKRRKSRQQSQPNKTASYPRRTLVLAVGRARQIKITRVGARVLSECIRKYA